MELRGTTLVHRNGALFPRYRRDTDDFYESEVPGFLQDFQHFVPLYDPYAGSMSFVIFPIITDSGFFGNCFSLHRLFPEGPDQDHVADGLRDHQHSQHRNRRSSYRHRNVE